MPLGVAAGKGEYGVYRIAVQGSDTAKLTAGKHYVGIDAMSWYLNKESSFFSDRMASGTLGVQLADGRETYEVALGTFQLSGGNKTAPVFDKPVVPDRNYRGGVLTFNAKLGAVKKDTAVAALLRGAMKASFSVAAGMVETATVAGPSLLLKGAGSSLIQGVTELLSKGEKQEPIFDFSGLEKSLRPEEIVGPESFLLLHRGTKLAENKLSVGNEGARAVPLYDGQSLEDGAWLLLRVRRSDEYSGVRDWFEDSKRLRQRITSLVDDHFAGLIPKSDALAEFASSPIGSKTLQDEYLRVRALINQDGVISEREALGYISQLRTRMQAAKDAIEAGQRSHFDATIAAATEAFTAGSGLKTSLSLALLEEAGILHAARVGTIAEGTPVRRVFNVESEGALAELRYMPNLLKRYAGDQLL